MASPVRAWSSLSQQHRLAIDLQSMLAFDILLCAGRFPGKEHLGLNDKIPLLAPLNGDPDASCET